MKHRLPILFLGASMAALAACATTPAPEPAPIAPAAEPVAAPAPEKSAHDRLFELFKASDEASLKRNPLNAIFRGDLRYADRLGDGITDEYYTAEKAARKAISPRFAPSRATSSMRPTSSPTTCSNIRPRTRCAGTSRTF